MLVDDVLCIPCDAHNGSDLFYHHFLQRVSPEWH